MTCRPHGDVPCDFPFCECPGNADFRRLHNIRTREDLHKMVLGEALFWELREGVWFRDGSKTP